MVKIEFYQPFKASEEVIFGISVTFATPQKRQKNTFSMQFYKNARKNVDIPTVESDGKNTFSLCFHKWRDNC